MSTLPKRRSRPRQPPRGKKATTKVFVVDDHPITRAGIVQLIESEPGLSICGQAATRAEALRFLAAYSPDLVTVDLSLPGGGFELIKDIRTLTPQTIVLVISMLDERVYAHRILHAGASGYVMKEAGAEVVLCAVKTVLEGKTYVSPAMEERFVEAMAHGRPDTRPDYGRLTTRELQILEAIGQGKCTKEIATEFHLSARTIDCHRSNIRKKVGLGGSADLLKYAVFWWESQRVRDEGPQ
jgi:DNA-binding NarL/FixJ family response regulator